MKKKKRMIMEIVIMLFLIMIINISAFAEEDLPEFQSGDYFILGQYNGEPILWKYIKYNINHFGHDYENIFSPESNGMLLYSDKILCFKEFDVSKEDELLTNAWEDCSLRGWLNSVKESDDVYAGEAGFLANKNFTKEERNIIKTSKNKLFASEKKYAENQEYTSNFFGNTIRLGRFHGDIYEPIKSVSELYHMYITGKIDEIQDKIFLLDEKAVYNIYASTHSAAAGLAKTSIVNNVIEGYNYAYWIRTPFNGSYYNPAEPEPETCTISGENENEPYREKRATSFESYLFNECGDKYDKSAVDIPQGVRPAFYLNTDNAIVLFGTGSKEDPYILGGKPVTDIFVNGEELVFEQEPYIQEEIVYIPLRAVFENLGATVEWTEEMQMVTVSKGKDKITLQIGSSLLKKNGEAIDLGYPVQLKEERTFVPLSAVEEGLSLPVVWDGENLRAEIMSSSLVN